jgi:hypothetical protein
MYGNGGKQEFSAFFFVTRPATIRPFFQGLDCRIDFADGWLPILRMTVFEVVAELLEIFCGGSRPTEAHT